jgi:hypothetical protein
MRRLAGLVAVWLCAAAPTLAQPSPQRFALIVSGASAGQPYAERYDTWRTKLVSTLRDRFEYPADHVVVLAEQPGAGEGPATRDGVRSAIAGLRQRMTPADQLLVVLIGHGSSENTDDAKFNLVGPDLSATEWAALLRTVPGHLVFVDTTSGSAPFTHALAARGRVVLTADDTVAQQFETVFPEYFIDALQDPAADADKDGRVSIWEAFVFAAAGVRNHYDGAQQLPTERAVLDDDGDGVGREAGEPGRDGDLARVTYVAPQTEPTTNDPQLAALIAQREKLEAQLDRLRADHAALSPDRYADELERLLVEIARLSQQIRNR